MGEERKIFPLRVECYAGYRSEETPRRFFIGGRRVETVQVIDRWLAPKHRYFKIRGDHGDVYLLRHYSETGGWELIMFERGG